MIHIITTLILISITILPYLFGRYIVYKEKPERGTDIVIYWLTGILPIVIIFLLAFLYVLIYNIVE